MVNAQTGPHPGTGNEPDENLLTTPKSCNNDRAQTCARLIAQRGPILMIGANVEVAASDTNANRVTADNIDQGSDQDQEED